MRDSIKDTFKDKKVYAVGASVSRFRSYGSLDRINNADLQNALLIVLDVPNMARVDGIEYLKYKEILRIDHHPTEDIIGKYDWADTKKSSTSQMVTELILGTKLLLSTNVAENLFLGIVSDSERFSLKNTTAETFDTTKRLIEESNINFPELYATLYERPMAEHKFIAFITNNLVIDENGLASIFITDDILKEYNVDAATPSNLINNFNFISEILVWTFITEDLKNNQLKVSMRSRGPIINEVAAKYNGGGHIYACGAKLHSVEEMNNMIKDLSEVCNAYKNREI